MSNIIKGKYGEELSCEYLIKKGYKIIETNYKYSRYGEIDIIALSPNDELCFVEVKTRYQDKFGSPLEAITKDKLLKIYSCIKEYSLKTKIKYRRCRIDALSIEVKDKEILINHIENIEI